MHPKVLPAQAEVIWSHVKAHFNRFWGVFFVNIFMFKEYVSS